MHMPPPEDGRLKYPRADIRAAWHRRHAPPRTTLPGGERSPLRELRIGREPTQTGPRLDTRATGSDDVERGDQIGSGDEADEFARLVDDGEAVGYVFVLPERLAFLWDAAVINELYVATDYRGRGAAEALLDAAIDFAREQALPLERLLLDVDPDNERAYAFYQKFGFEPWGGNRRAGAIDYSAVTDAIAPPMAPKTTG